jgi:hypothetical protein
MARVTEYDSEASAAMAAREEFIAIFCHWWPAIYKAQVPLTRSGKELVEAKQRIERIMAEDHAAYTAEQQNPWRKVGTEPKWIDWSGFSATERCTVWPEWSRPLGMPATPKQGFEKHPDVEAAWADSHRMVEYVAFIKQQRARREWIAASHEWAEATNSGADKATVQKLKDKETAAAKAHTAAQQAFESLLKNPARGLKIVRNALTFDERIAEQKSIERNDPKSPTAAEKGPNDPDDN